MPKDKKHRHAQASIGGPIYLTDYGRKLIAADMYSKGRGFVYAAILLSRAKGDPSVELHLHCQGLEITLKAILLRIDFARYQPLLKTKFGHDIARLAREANRASGRRPFTGKLDAELQQLSELYRATVLRYAGLFSMMVAPETIPTKRVMRMFAALMIGLESKRVLFSNSPDSQAISN
jgi:hypothetical protein